MMLSLGKFYLVDSKLVYVVLKFRFFSDKIKYHGSYNNLLAKVSASRKLQTEL